MTSLQGVLVRTRSRIALLVTLAVAVCSVAVIAGASARPISSRTVAVHRVRAATSARSYWTARRMAAAIPADVLEISQQGRADRAPESAATLGAGGVGPSAPDGTVPLAAGSLTPADGSLSTPLAYPYTSGPVATSDYRTYPYSTIGRIFFTNPIDGLNYACSGTALTSANESVVWTAGHCVHGGGPGNVYYTHWVFVPSYVDHTRPAGTWSALALLAPAQWIADENLHYDMGAAIVAPVSGQRLTEVTGGRGIEWNLPQDQTFDAFGYPAASPFTGERIYHCLADLGTTSNPGGPGPATLGIGCDMTQGSSGGGWVVANDFVNSNVSYGIEGEPGVIYGPYFGDVAATLYETASTSTLPGPLPTPTVPPAGGDATATPTAPSGGGPSPDPTPSETPDTVAPALTRVVDRPDPFSPNGDGLKDKVRLLFTLSEPGTVTITIFKPSGAPLGYLVSGAGAPDAARYVAKWNGKVGSKTVRNGTYGYQIAATDLAGNESTARGTTTVAR